MLQELPWLSFQSFLYSHSFRLQSFLPSSLLAIKLVTMELSFLILKFVAFHESLCVTWLIFTVLYLV